MDRTKIKALCFRLSAERLDILDIENQLYQSLTLFLALARRVQKECGSGRVGAQFNDPVAGCLNGLEIKVTAIERRHGIHMFSIDQDASERVFQGLLSEQSFGGAMVTEYPLLDNGTAHRAVAF